MGSSLTGLSPERLLRLKRALAASSPRYAMRSGCLAADRGALKPQKSGSRKAVFAQHRLSPAPAAAVLLRGTDGVYWLQVAFRDSGVGKELSVDTAYLREYIEFSRSLNFAQAAADLFVSPPTLRAHLHALEEEVGAPLTAKRAGQLELSPAGRLFLKRARAIVKLAEESAEECRALAEASSSIMVGTLDYAPFEELLTRAARFPAGAPWSVPRDAYGVGRLREYGSSGEWQGGSFHLCSSEAARRRERGGARWAACRSGSLPFR